MDLDDTMTTSTASSSGDVAPADYEEDDNLFPESRSDGRPSTPQNNHLNASAPGELSPPRSQHQVESQPPDSVPNGHQGATSEGDGTLSSLADERDERPGHGWKNKKAQEEMQRAWENVVDRDFSLKEFGDVIMQGKAQMGEI